MSLSCVVAVLSLLTCSEAPAPGLVQPFDYDPILMIINDVTERDLGLSSTKGN